MMYIQPEKKSIPLSREGYSAVVRELTPPDYVVVSEILGAKKDDDMLYENALVSLSLVSITYLDAQGQSQTKEFKVDKIDSYDDLMKRQLMPIKDWMIIAKASGELNSPNPDQLGK